MRACKGGFVAVAGMVLWTGCGAAVEVSVNRSEATDAWISSDGEWSRPNDLGVKATRMRGDLGALQAFDVEAERVASVDFPGFSTVELAGTSAEGAVMLAITVSGGLANPELQPGADRGYGEDAPEGETDVDVTGCQGPGMDDWDYDENADEVDVRIAALPSGGRRMNLVARWKDHDTGRVLHEATATFDYDVPAGTPR